MSETEREMREYRDDTHGELTDAELEAMQADAMSEAPPPRPENDVGLSDEEWAERWADERAKSVDIPF